MSYQLIATLAIVGSAAIAATVSHAMNRDDTSDAGKLLYQFLNIVAVILLSISMMMNLQTVREAAGLTSPLLSTGYAIFQWTILIMAGIMMISLLLGVFNQKATTGTRGGRTA